MTDAQGHDDTPAVDDELEQDLDELAEELREPHADEEERRRRQQAAEEAGSNPRRES